MNNVENQSTKKPTIQKDSIDDDINLLDYLRVIYKFRRMIVLICAVIVIATAIICL